ncbi:Cu2+-exporting ATPase [Mesorhizobium albiziae]|uniref:Cu2+-exporting ATPase n=2 Tax=Neomesorhizobium albiziae TaxID=335020 RepID=A0A1I3ZNU5_9HYPH|nr:copper-translocating P-type ATPase [Mesorhizobium albiziae]SFK45762.1 Cu2+-exporting ATPase [Mesorhizobium albiziae]
MALELERAAHAGSSAEELELSSRPLGNGLRQIDLSVPSVHCGACIQSIERALSRLDGVDHARVNLSTKRVSVHWREGNVPPLVETLNRLGYAAHLFDEGAEGRDKTLSELIRALAVAGFAAGNIMLLSVSVWSGADGATRDLFHLVSALIAIPAMVFAGGIYFRSAWSALRYGRMNMDVPIALGVSLAFGMSLYETINHGEHAYFDAAVSLLFFLLIGRTLDHVMRDRARAAVAGLAKLAPRGAVVVREDESRGYLSVASIEPGMRLLIAAGERVPVDGRVTYGSSDLDCSLVSGESEPQRVQPGDTVRAGTLNLTGSLTIEAIAAAKDSFFAEMVRLMEAAEGGRARYRRIADRASALYSPVVHLTALLTFIGWMVASGDWHRAITIAIAVLIITCPCALGLAVPIVQVVAARRLFENGIMVKDGSAMERLAEIDTVVFDKTGTLTVGRPVLSNAGDLNRDTLALASAIAWHSRHPLSRAIADAYPQSAQPHALIETVAERPGYGIEASKGGKVYRLGRADWAISATANNDGILSSGTVLAENGCLLASFQFEDRIRDGARPAISELKEQGLAVEMLSGDRTETARTVSEALAVEHFEAEALPRDKAARLSGLSEHGCKALMVGDGLNDAPALAAAYVSMAPATAADVGRNAADFVFLRETLTAVPFAVEISRKADRLFRQNFALAIGYNAIAVPIAILGYVTPLIAAVAMSLSSILVIGNAMRLGGEERRPYSGARPVGERMAPWDMMADS